MAVSEDREAGDDTGCGGVMFLSQIADITIRPILEVCFQKL